MGDGSRRGVGRAKMEISYYDFPAAFPPSPVARARTKQEQPMAMEGRGFGLMKIDMKARFCACVREGAVKGEPWLSKQSCRKKMQQHRVILIFEALGL